MAAFDPVENPRPHPVSGGTSSASKTSPSGNIQKPSTGKKPNTPPRAGTPQPAHCRAKPVRQPVDEAIEAMIAVTRRVVMPQL